MASAGVNKGYEKDSKLVPAARIIQHNQHNRAIAPMPSRVHRNTMDSVSRCHWYMMRQGKSRASRHVPPQINNSSTPSSQNATSNPPFVTPALCPPSRSNPLLPVPVHLNLFDSRLRTRLLHHTPPSPLPLLLLLGPSTTPPNPLGPPHLQPPAHQHNLLPHPRSGP